MAYVFTHIGVFCLGLILGLGEENDYIKAVLMLCWVGWVYVTLSEDVDINEEDEEDKIQEVEERRPATRIVKNPYYNRYKP